MDSHRGGGHTGLRKSQTRIFGAYGSRKCLASGPLPSMMRPLVVGPLLLVSNAVQSKAGHTRERRHTHWCSRRRSRPQTRGHRDRSAVRSSACQTAPFIGSGGPSPAPGNHTTTNPLYTTTNALYNDTIIAAFSLEDVVSLCALVQHTTATPTSARSRDQPLTSRTTELCMHRQQAPTSSARCRSDSCYCRNGSLRRNSVLAATTTPRRPHHRCDYYNLHHPTH
jgi:hypothetical protein